MLSYHPTLAERSRLTTWSRSDEPARAWEVAALVGCGLLASAAVTFLDFSLRIPGHAILRSVVPMSFGLALIPRRGAGLCMSAAALVGVLGIGITGISAGAGATTSLLCIGPLLDLASRRAGGGWQLAAAFGAAGLAANLLAFVARAATKVGGGGGLRGSAGPAWWSMAPVTYALCGLIAGVLCALIWFRWRSPAADVSRDKSRP